MFEIVFYCNVKDNNIFPCLHVLDFPITYRNALVLCQSEHACLHITVNTVVFFVKCNENTYPKGRPLMPMYRVVLIKKRRNTHIIALPLNLIKLGV